MIVKNVVTPEKKNHIIGYSFHLFYLDINTAILFDSDLSIPIIYGTKIIVINQLKKIDELLKATPATKIKLFTYNNLSDGYKRIQTYIGPISDIGAKLRLS